MSSICAGLIGDAPQAAYRVLLGTHPNLTVDKRLIRQLQAVFPWYASRRRVKEQATEFLELDLASVDAETMLRYSHVFFVRRELHRAIVEKQIQLLDTGKPPKLADASLMACLADCNAEIAPRLHHEVKILTNVKRACAQPFRRELDPAAPFESSDILCMMRCAEEDATGDADVEIKCKQFIDAERVYNVGASLQRTLLGSAKPLDKKDLKLVQKHLLPDYAKVGWAPKLRPLDVTAYMRFLGERSVGSEEPFARAVWGHVFRRYALHPGTLQLCGTFSKDAAGPEARGDCAAGGHRIIGQIPFELAERACEQQNMFAGIKFRSQFVYCGVDVARQGWAGDTCVPSLRLFPLMGETVAEDLLAGLVVDNFFHKSGLLASGENLLDEGTTRRVREFASDLISARESSLEQLLQQALEGARAMIPPPSEEERALVASAAAATAAAVPPAGVSAEGDATGVLTAA